MALDTEQFDALAARVIGTVDPNSTLYERIEHFCSETIEPEVIERWLEGVLDKVMLRIATGSDPHGIIASALTYVAVCAMEAERAVTIERAVNAA